MSFTYLQTDDYVWKLLEILVQQPKKELHLYAVHSIENPILAEEDEIEDIYKECAFDGVFDRDGDRVGEEESDAFNLHADKEDGKIRYLNSKEMGRKMIMRLMGMMKL
ncbi:hypothetical protein CJ030_MR7G024260 [Morella rubra]|uniref:Uncharacterized protein n=1 Tax=Morella rubra TaxID=262757 RepID=A0A6A1V7M7_9ROSI|nr:hypothetical protein CJ030_MR7G024260 [Morella rubra]